MRTLAATCLVLALAATGAGSRELVRRIANTISYQQSTILVDSWTDYKKRYCEADVGRIIDHQRGAVTTSEGQSYALLRAVWIGDKTAFDRILIWTRESLQHSNNHLFSWLYGRAGDGKTRVLYEQGGMTAATDADTDIALSLILAYARWHDQTYLEEAKEVIADVWKYEVVYVKGAPVLAANDLGTSSGRFLDVNPSYYSPYAYRLFAVVDPEHHWLALAENSYAVLNASLDVAGSGSTRALPPDWVLMDRETGELSCSSKPDRACYFGADALRVPWRVAVDWRWNRDPRALYLLKRMTVLSEIWKRNHKLMGSYSATGEAVASYEFPAMYGASLGYFLTLDPVASGEIWKRKIAGRFSPSLRSWQDGYYDENWLWFGLALKEGVIGDLGASRAVAAMWGPLQ